jgi:hypothetical protein
MSDEDRETMQQELMDLGVWLIAHPEAAVRNLKPIRSAKLLEPGVYSTGARGWWTGSSPPSMCPSGTSCSA